MNNATVLRFVFSTSSSKSVAQCELERPLPAGAKELPCSAQRLVEAGIRHHRIGLAGDYRVAEPRVIVVVETANIRNVE